MLKCVSVSLSYSICVRRVEGNLLTIVCFVRWNRMLFERDRRHKHKSESFARSLSSTIECVYVIVAAAAVNVRLRA